MMNLFFVFFFLIILSLLVRTLGLGGVVGAIMEGVESVEIEGNILVGLVLTIE